MSRSMGARRRLSKSSPQLPKVFRNKEGDVTYILGNMFWTSAELVDNPANEGLTQKFFPPLVRKPGATIRRLKTPDGKVAYCHAGEYLKKVAEL